MASGYLARRNALAQQAGFRNYYEQRKYRAKAASMGAPKGLDKRSVRARDEIGKAIKDLRNNGGARDDLVEQFGELFDEYDIDYDFSEQDWYDFLEEESAKEAA